MSFEGYYQALCANGHQTTCDVHAIDDDIENLACWVPNCGCKIAWWNIVDVTNGSFGIDADGNESTAIRIDGYIELEEAVAAVTCTCAACGNTHVVEPTRYRAPMAGGHLAK